MPSPGRFERAHAQERWKEPWEEQVIAHSERHRGRPRWANLWMPVILSFALQVPAVFFHFRFGGGVVPSEAWGHPDQLLLEFLVAVIGPLALIGARRFPGPVVAIAAAAGVVDFLLFRESSHPPYIALAFAIISAIVRGARIWAWISVASAWAIGLTVALVMGLDLAPQRIAAVTFGILLLMGIGEGIRTRRDRFSEISRRVAERKQSEVAAERVRIARELHDVLAHSLSQINVQAGVGLHLMDRQPDKAKEALASIKETSKTALDEVRSVLGLLRAEGGADPGAPLIPEPDLSRLAGLAASMSAQGVTVAVDNTIRSAPSSAVQLALYRIAQEALTNVLRHANATRVVILVSEDASDYRLTITDDGTGSTTPRAGEGGRGLLGMHERADLLGGALSAGPLPTGGFQVAASIPIHRGEFQ